MCQPASLISQPATLTACARGAEHERYIFRGMTQGGGGARTREKVAGRVRTVARNAKQASLSSTVGRSAWRDGREVVNQLPERSWTTSYSLAVLLFHTTLFSAMPSLSELVVNVDRAVAYH